MNLKRVVLIFSMQFVKESQSMKKLLLQLSFQKLSGEIAPIAPYLTESLVLEAKLSLQLKV